MAYGATGAGAQPAHRRLPHRTDDRSPRRTAPVRPAATPHGDARTASRPGGAVAPAPFARALASTAPAAAPARAPLAALAALAALATALLALAAPAGAATKRPQLSARAAFLIETRTGDTVYASRPDARLPIASTTKIITALVALERLKLSQTVAAVPYRGAAAESRLGLRGGERMTVADLLRALMLPSANDGAATLARRAAGGRGAFVRAMNDKARMLRLANTHFVNPVGLDDPGNYASARDLATMARALMRHPFMRRVVGRTTATLRSGDRERQIVNRNTLVRQYPWITGVKTGHTIQAGYVLVGSAQRRGVELISVVIGTPSEATRDADTLALLRYGFDRYRRKTVVKRGRVLAKATVKYRRGAEVAFAAGRRLRLVAKRGTRYRLRVVGAPTEVEGPIRAGQKMGTVEVYAHPPRRSPGRRKRVAVLPLVAATDVAEASLPVVVKDYVTRPLTLVLVALAIVATVQVAFLRRRAGRPRRQEVETA